MALGTSSKRVVEGVHDRPRVRTAAQLEETAAALRVPLHGEPGEPVVPGSGFRRRQRPPGGPLTVAAFGERAIATAAAHADRMLLDVVSPEQVRILRAKMLTAAERAGRTPPRLAAWLPAAVDPDPASLTQVPRSLAGAGADTGGLLRALPVEAAAAVGPVGGHDAVGARLGDYAAAGLDEVALVPATAGDPGGERTLTALAPG